MGTSIYPPLGQLDQWEPERLFHRARVAVYLVWSAFVAGTFFVPALFVWRIVRNGGADVTA